MIEQKAPIPLESLSPLPERNVGRELEKGQYWNHLLTGDLSTVPETVRRKAGAADESLPAEERDYRLAASINRSWVVDHRNMSREEVSAAWPDLRREMAEELGVADNENEVYAGLSLRHSEEPLREQVRRLFRSNYEAALKGESPALPEPADERRVCETAQAHAQRTREEYLPLAESVSEGWSALKALESEMVSFPELISGAPGLLRAVDTLADMEPDERHKVYAIARSLPSAEKLQPEPESLGRALLHGVRRGADNLRHSMLQGAGHIAAAGAHHLADAFDLPGLHRAAEFTDKRLQVLHELRGLAHHEVFPIKLEDESSCLERLALDAAEAVPGAVLSFAGGAGFGCLALSATGAAVAEARKRSPETSQNLQALAGLTAAALQTGISMAFNRIGGDALNRTINNFAKARHAGFKGYSLAALKSLGSLSGEAVVDLLCGKISSYAEQGLQELASRVDGVASNINWKELGTSESDIDTQLREAAMNLPYYLIGAGRAALHHFRAPQALLENTAVLEKWGIDEAARRHIQEQPDIHAQSQALSQALCTSRRWGGAGMLVEALRALRLLNTETHRVFNDEQDVRSFLNLPADSAARNAPEPPERDLSTPESLKEVNLLMNGRKTELPNAQQLVPLIRLWDEWNFKAQGERIRQAENFQGRAMRYLEFNKDKKKVLPREYRLDGYYTPYRAELVRHVVNDHMQEIINLSYQYLMNTESLDSLRHSYKTEKIARARTEARRQELLGHFCAALESAVRTGDAETALKSFSSYLEKKYSERRRLATHAPTWMRKAQIRDFENGYETACRRILKYDRKKPRELWEAYRIMLGFRACAGSLLDIIPHSADFQELLNLGYSPEDSFTHLLRREMQGNYSESVWNPQKLGAAQRNDVDNMQRLAGNRNPVGRYMLLSGYPMESSPDGSGKTLWRTTRPDGTKTPWFPSQAMVVNSLAGNARTLFLPTGRGLLLDNIRNSYRYTPQGKAFFHAAFMYPPQPRTFTGFDHLASTASRDLCSLWLGDSTLYPIGLEFAANMKKWKNFRGPALQYSLKPIPDGNDGYLVKVRKTETPLSLARTRFRIYWLRQLSSGWVEPEQVARTLVEAGAMSPDTLEDIMAQGRDKKMSLNKIRLERRRRLLQKYPDGIIPGNKEKVCSELACRMAELNLLHMMANLPSAKLPDSVREWFYNCAFSGKAAESLPFEKGHVRRINRASADEVKRLIPRVVHFRKLEKKPELDDMMRDAYEPNEARRYEQGWCFSVGGSGAFRSAGQSHWNLLDDPVRGWKLLTPEERRELHGQIQDLCRGREPEQALQELSEVLREYPGLRAYSSDARLGGQVKRLNLAPIPSVNIAEPVYTLSESAAIFRPLVVKKGFTVEEQASLPPEWQSDSRVLPALQLLTELRRSITQSPYADEKGIWWKQERYGGVDGKRPEGIDARWDAESGLAAFMEFYKRTADMEDAGGSNGPLKVCGVSLGGIRPGEIDLSTLNNVTVYRSSRMPEHQVRLMPGEPNASNPYQRKPYVVHTADGIPLFATSMARYEPRIMQTFKPLNAFKSDLERAYDFASNHRWRKRHMEHYLTDLLENRTLTAESWEQSDESRINNLELFMQMFQDSRLSYYLEAQNPATLTRGEALAAELGRLMLLAEFGTNREQNVQELLSFCHKLRDSKQDKELLQIALHRVVSPEPKRFRDIELSVPGDDGENEPSDDDAEQD